MVDKVTHRLEHEAAIVEFSRRKEISAGTSPTPIIMQALPSGSGDVVQDVLPGRAQVMMIKLTIWENKHD